MHEQHTFTWLSLIPGLGHAPIHVVTAVLVTLLILVTTFVARSQLLLVMRHPDGGLIPDAKLTYRNFFEIIAEKLYALTENVIGPHDAPIYFPVIGTLFIFIFTSNLIGLIPGFLPPTDNLNTTLGLGVFVFIYYNYAGIRAHGLAYLKHFLGPILWLAPLMLIIELASHIFRPLSLGLRLRGNIMGDHVVLGVFSGLVPYALPIVFYGLGLFVAFIQAFVFCLMTMVYISLSTAHDH
ncbi:MAG: F0F1 ATP synthase subunit A [Oligoflexia bacterium]|nr:F0F1 ATP synthase subunit A [Oligoflexia bacterium]